MIYAIVEINQGYVERDVVLCDSLETVELYLISEYGEYGRNYFKSYFYEQLNISYEDYQKYVTAYAQEEDDTDLLVRIRSVLDDKLHSVKSISQNIFDKHI